MSPFPLAASPVAGAFLLFLLVGVGLGLLLWALVESEGEAERTTHPDWESAERAARRDRDDASAGSDPERRS